MPQNKNSLTSIVLAVVLGVFLGWGTMRFAGVRQYVLGETTSSASADMRLFYEAWRKLSDTYYKPEELQEDRMIEGATAGMVDSLGDAYTLYLPPENNDRSNEDIAGSFYGIGVELAYIDGVVGIQAPIADTPAERAGIQARDVFIHIKDEINDVDEEVYDWTIQQIQNVLRAKDKTPVTITLFRSDYNNNEPFEVTIVREEIKMQSVWLEFVTNSRSQTIAHLRVGSFGERTTEEWNQAVKDILARGNIAGIALDVRNNPGGLVWEAIKIASEFIEDGVILHQEGRKSSNTRDYESTGRSRLKDIPVVVLVNGGSASSSEIVAGALRDRLDTTIIGSKTFGKGLVQERIDLSNGGGLHVTVATWKLPNGDWIQDKGIEVDIEAKNDYQSQVDEVLNVAIEQF
ncbi:S41 family peptidase [Microgenomates group bacterium]|nr:S41 family peptidase [Microgenomates group bacterium]